MVKTGVEPLTSDESDEPVGFITQWNFLMTWMIDHLWRSVVTFNIRCPPDSSEKQLSFYVRGSVRRESISIIVQQVATICSFIFCRQLHMFRMIPSSIIRSTFKLYLQHLALVEPYLLPSVDVESWSSDSSTSADGSKYGSPVADVVITVWTCSWWWMRVSSETCRAVGRKYNRTVYSRILLDDYWH